LLYSVGRRDRKKEDRVNKIVLRNGFVYKKEGIVKADLLISEGKLFLQFSKMDEEGATVYDVDGKLIVPGFVGVTRSGGGARGFVAGRPSRADAERLPMVAIRRFALCRT